MCVGGATCGRRGERENFRARARVIGCVEVGQPDICGQQLSCCVPSPGPHGFMLGSAPGFRESCWAVSRKETRHQGPDQPVWLSWRPIWDPGAGPSKGQMRLFLVLMP